jgi:RNA polymerase sigma factor (sigma-70 family)
MPGEQRHEDRYLWEALSHEGLLVRVIRKYLHNDSDVEEILGDTYVKLLEAGSDKQQDVRSVPAFAVAIASRLAIDRLRREKSCVIDSQRDTALPGVIDDRPPLEMTLDRERTLARLEAAIQSFSPACQRVLRLRWFRGLKVREIAVELGISENGVKYHLKKANKAFPNILFLLEKLP